MAASSTTPGTQEPSQARAIPGFLARVRHVLYRHEAARAVLYAVAAVGGVCLVVPVLGHLFGGSRASAVTVLGIAGLAAALVVLGAIVMGLVAPRRRYRSDADVARWVGTRKREVASDLLSSVELAEAPVRPGAPSQELVDALIASTASRLDGVEPRALLPEGEVRRALRWMLVALLANALLIAAAPGVVAGGWLSLVRSPEQPFDGAQLSTVPLVGDLDAVLTFPAYSKRQPLPLPSSSGDVRGLPGTKVDLKARVLVPAAAVELLVDTDKPDEPTTIKATLEGDQMRASFVIDKSTRYRFAVVGPAGSRAIETTPRSIDAEPDQAPNVQLMAPADELDVTNLRRVELAFVIEDDFGLTTAELVWEAGRDKGKKPIPLEGGAAMGSGRAQGKLLWDIAEIVVPSGGEVRYWVEAKDNNSVGGGSIGKSRELRLKVVSPRERHEETLGRQQELAEKIVKNLGGRLVLKDEAEPAPREELARVLKEAVVELGSIGAAYEKDPHASEAMRKALAAMRERLDKLATAEARLLPSGKAGKAAGFAPGRFAGLDPRIIAELEDDTITLADWLDRERLEGLLDVSDEISAHQKRLADLMAQYAKTKDPRLLDEIEREMKALERAYADLEKHRRGMAEDVLDQYVNRSAVQAQQGQSCLEEVRKLLRAGQTAQAQAKLEQCRTQHDRSSSALEGSLANLRGDKFSDEQRKLDEVMNELADVAKDQDDIAAEANRIFESYAEKADEVAKDSRREASKKVGALVEKLRKRLGDINEAGLTPFAKEELDIVERRLGDVEKMVEDGDLAEALGMARQAKTSLDTIAGELEAAINDDPKSKWADATQDALDGVERANPIAKDLIKELQSLSPRPDQIMSPDDMRAMDRLRRRQQMNKGRAQRLAERTKQLGGDLPGDAGAELGKKLGGAVDQMGNADDRAKARDPSGTREAARAAAEALAKARDRARSAARQAQEGSSVGDEPIRIPGADEYRAPERFREDLLEAMKKKGSVAPDGYDDMIKRYYEELIK
ncbi:MAG: hypothetical protein JNL83_01665 [Myxococcales bacterium]|nr:hypothetical protein [Myxococcales bacterium]